jgi:hypothetical protein
MYKPMHNPQPLVGWLVYSCCSHLVHRASMKQFFSLQFLNLRYSVGLPRRVIIPSQGRYRTQIENKRKQISMPRVRFELHDPSVRASEDSSCLIPRSHCDRQSASIAIFIFKNVPNKFLFIKFRERDRIKTCGGIQHIHQHLVLCHSFIKASSIHVVRK